MKGGAGRALKMKAPRVFSPGSLARLRAPAAPGSSREERQEGVPVPCCWGRGLQGHPGSPHLGHGGRGRAAGCSQEAGICAAHSTWRRGCSSSRPNPAPCRVPRAPTPHTEPARLPQKRPGRFGGTPPRAVLATQGFGDRMWPVSQGGWLGRQRAPEGSWNNDGVWGAGGSPGSRTRGCHPPRGSSAGSTSPFQAESGCAAEFLSPACPLS